MRRLPPDTIRARWGILLVLLLCGVIHGFNMFGFPYYENDEGVYLSQAWSLLTAGKLAPYTYWYDHAPAGWIFTAVWLALTRGLFTFGFSLNSGRVFMLVIHLASVYLLIRIARKLTAGVLPGFIAAFLFTFSPLGLYFQRRLLLDNLMIFWVLWSYNFLLGHHRRLLHFVFSAVLFSIAILTKENAIFFIPGFLLTLYYFSQSAHRLLAIFKWLIIVASVTSFYFLYALLKGEFFPYGTPLGGQNPHVSLLATLVYQYSRTGAGSFTHNFQLWLNQDKLIILVGLAGNLVLLLLSVLPSRRHYLGLAVLGLAFWFFLVRGGIVIEFYILPLLPLMGLYTGLAVWEFSRIFNFSKLLPAVLLALLVYYSFNSQISRSFGQNNTGKYIFRSQQTLGQIQAVAWAQKYLDPSSVIIIDNYSFLQFRAPDNPSHVYFPRAQWYWKVNQDTEIKDNLLHNSAENIDYIFETPQMQGDLITGVSPLTTDAINHSQLVKSFNTEGWGVNVWAARYPAQILRRSWQSYKSAFLEDGSRSLDPGTGLTTSEGQSYALMRAVWMDDQPAFDRVWHWTSANLQRPDGTFMWKWGTGPDGSGQVLDRGTAADADSDIALSLLFAFSRWRSPEYLTAGLTVLNGIWNTDVRRFRGQNYPVPGDWAGNKDVLVINPSYLSPYAYRIFAAADANHDWNSLVDSSYYLLSGCLDSSLGGASAAPLLPNWCQLNSAGIFGASSEPGLTSTAYSYDALRTLWRLGLDYRWYGEPRAKALLYRMGSFLLNKWQTDGRLLVGYTHSGQPWEKYESVLGYAANLPAFSVVNQAAADEIYRTRVLEKYYENFDERRHYWEDPQNYYTQNWAWFGTAFYADRLPNLWNVGP